uniref:RING-type domain-containing protein n=2 Tax=Schistocephalus solidus TaxID=70667 RepID=A0A0X3NLJ2_SCHSO
MTLSMSSHLVETMMINVEDFSDSFLTCGTCLSGYNSSHHAAKILPCSHTICRSCLERILETQQNDESFRCPICRETITVPAGGAAAFPPAFIVNQLLDLLASQRRDRVPKCRLHPGQELLFCETCDVVFCPDCGGRGARGHATEPCGGSIFAGVGSNGDNSLLAAAASLPVLSTGSGQSSRPHSGAASGYESSRADLDHAGPTGSGQTGVGGSGGAALNHNVISFSVAIKRCSQILLYKAHLCVQELNSAQEAVTAELERLTESSDACIAAAESSFSEVKALVERRQAELLHSIRRLTEEKRRALLDQLALIESERDLVKEQCAGLNAMPEHGSDTDGDDGATAGDDADDDESEDSPDFQMDVRSISKGISYLNDKLDTIASLTEPRENAFLRYQDKPVRQAISAGPPGSQAAAAAAVPAVVSGSASIVDVARCLAAFGRIAVSTTYPPLCTAKLPDLVHVHLPVKVIVRAYDYHGQPQTVGTDPITAHFTDSHGREAPSHLLDLGNGSYEITLLPVSSGAHKLSVNILSRPIRGSPFLISVRARQAPYWCLHEAYEGRTLVQPVAVSVLPPVSPPSQTASHGASEDAAAPSVAVSTAPSAPAVPPGSVLLLDTGNSRLLVLDSDSGSVNAALVNDALKGQAATGMALCPAGLWIVNWRVNELLLLDLATNEIRQKISSPLFMEPTSVCVCPRTGRVLVADNGAGCVFECRRQISPSDSGENQQRQHQHLPLCPGSPGDRVLVSPLIDSRCRTTTSNTVAGNVQHRKTGAVADSATAADGFSDALRRVTAICIASSGEIILAAGAELQIYSPEGHHLGDLTPPAFSVDPRALLMEPLTSVSGSQFPQRTSTLPTPLSMNSSAPGSTLTLMAAHRASSHRPPSLGGTMRSAHVGGGGAPVRGHFGGVTMGTLAPGVACKDDLGECILASHTDRSRSAVVVWPESVWRSVIGRIVGSRPASVVNAAGAAANGTPNDSSASFLLDGLASLSVSSRDSTESLSEDAFRNGGAGGLGFSLMRQALKHPYILEVEPPQMRRLAGLAALTTSRSVVAADLGGQCAYCLRYA